MKYENVVSAKFISRPNRFVAKVLLNGEEISVHVKNTGRCQELLVPGTIVFLEDFSYRRGKRKLLYDLIAVKKGNLLINMDSQAPNKVVMEALKNGKINLPEMGKLITIRPEKTYGDSRFDFYIEDENGEKGFIEVKGVTLENNGVTSFPDAPTERGVKHINELIKAMKNGYHSYILFVVQMSEVKMFTPNKEMHKEFADALRNADKKGIHILVYKCDVTPDSIIITDTVLKDLK